MKQLSATVISNRELFGHLHARYHLMRVEAPDIAAIARPGQFVTVQCGQELTLRRPLSIHRVANSGELHLLFSIVGKGTSWLSHCQEGQRLDFLGPLGNGFSIEPASKKLLLVAGGIGIAPLTFLAQQVLSEGKAVTLLLGARMAAGLYPRKLLSGGIETVVVTEDGSSGTKGLITDILPDFVDWADQIYACGPLAMYQTIATKNRQRRVKRPVQISLEVRMGCGLGACYGCSIRTKRGMKQVCRDGPVFDLDDIIWQEVKT